MALEMTRRVMPEILGGERASRHWAAPEHPGLQCHLQDLGHRCWLRAALNAPSPGNRAWPDSASYLALPCFSVEAP